MYTFYYSFILVLQVHSFSPVALQFVFSPTGDSKRRNSITPKLEESDG